MPEFTFGRIIGLAWEEIIYKLPAAVLHVCSCRYRYRLKSTKSRTFCIHGRRSDYLIVSFGFVAWMNILKIVIHLCVITFASVSFPVVNVICGNLIFIVVLDVVFRIFSSSTELICTEFDSLTFNGTLCINAGQDKGAFVIVLWFRIIIRWETAHFILYQLIEIFESDSYGSFI